MFSKIYDSLFTLAYPQACQICANSVERLVDGVACGSCWNETKIFDGSETLCHKCSAFLIDKPFDSKTFCHQCDDDLFDRAIAVGLYQSALSGSVVNLKYEPFVAKRLQKLIISCFRDSDFQDTTLIIPVPLSKRRRIERGFNQAEVLAQILTKSTGIKIDKNILVRNIHTPVHRAGMDRRGRELTVKGAFEVRREKFIKGEVVLLIDDVFTSGATASNCAKVLKKKGADKVNVLTVARAF